MFGAVCQRPSSMKERTDWIQPEADLNPIQPDNVGNEGFWMVWESFSSNVWWDDLWPKADSVLNDPPYNNAANKSSASKSYELWMGVEEVREFAQFCRYVQRIGSFVFHFCSFNEFSRWCSHFMDSLFQVISYRYRVDKHYKTLQCSRSGLFSQELNDHSMIAPAMGDHPK